MPIRRPAPPAPASIHAAYAAAGPEAFYREHGGAYRNPHEPALAAVLASGIAAWQPDLSAVLDLACGSGEAATVFEAAGAPPVTGCDPYTGTAWRARMRRDALGYDFAAIAAGALLGRRFSLIVSSFALHLCPPSRLPALAIALAQLSRELWIATPHQRPHIAAAWGWQPAGELRQARVRLRRYRVG